MEPIIEFLEQYWGYTLFGGLTIGTIITFAFLMIKFLLKNKNAQALLNNLIQKTEALNGATVKERERAAKKEQEQEQEQIYNQRIITTLFEAVSYLVVASKLPIEEKKTLQRKFDKVIEEIPMKVEEVVEEVKPTIEVVKETVAKSKSLLDTYMEE